MDIAVSCVEQSQQRHRITNTLPVKGKEPYGNSVTSVNFQNKDIVKINKLNWLLSALIYRNKLFFRLPRESPEFMAIIQEGVTAVTFQLMMKKLVSFKKQAISGKLANVEKHESV